MDYFNGVCYSNYNGLNYTEWSLDNSPDATDLAYLAYDSFYN